MDVAKAPNAADAVAATTESNGQAQPCGNADMLQPRVAEAVKCSSEARVGHDAAAGAKSGAKSGGSDSVEVLNVAGECTVTVLRSTLTRRPTSRLARLVTDPKTPRDAQGRIFVDRDPEAFRSFVKWLRSEAVGDSAQWQYAETVRLRARTAKMYAKSGKVEIADMRAEITEWHAIEREYEARRKLVNTAVRQEAHFFGVPISEEQLEPALARQLRQWLSKVEKADGAGNSGAVERLLAAQVGDGAFALSEVREALISSPGSAARSVDLYT